MNSPTIIDELKTQLSNAKLEIKHLNAVNQELQDELTEAKRSAIEASDRAGNAKIQLDHAMTQLAVLKRDMVLLKPDYDLYQVDCSPESCELIVENPAKVIRNLMDIRTGLTAELETGLANFSAGDGIALLQVMGKSAADILHREFI